MRIYKTLAAATAAIGLLAGCQEKEIGTTNISEELVPVTLTASYATMTKVTYTEEEETDVINLQPTWNIGDTIIGFDSNLVNVTLTVTEINSYGVATLKGMCPAYCTLHLIYLHGSSANSISNGSMSLNYIIQKCDDTMPAVMLADGDVTNGSGSFHFTNAGAVIGIDALKGVPQGSTIYKILVNGDNLSEATIALDGSSHLHLTGKEEAKDWVYSSNGLSGLTVTDSDGTLSRRVLIAVPDGAKISEISVKAGEDFYAYTPVHSDALEAGQYAYVAGQQFSQTDYVNIRGAKWALENLAITPSGKREFNNTGHVNGDYFQWAAHENYALPVTDFGNGETDRGLVIYESFTSTMCGDDTDAIEFKTDPSSGKKYWFSKESNSTYASITPYMDPDTHRETKYGFDYLYRGGLELTPVNDDAANIILGDEWKMANSNAINALLSSTHPIVDKTDKGLYYFTAEPLSDANLVNLPTNIGAYDKPYALLFIPYAGKMGNWADGNGYTFYSVGTYGSFYLNIYIGSFPVGPALGPYRLTASRPELGHTIRPVRNE